MDITTFVSQNRDKAFIIGDYSSYRTQLARQILSLRRKLGRTTPKNEKNHAKQPVTLEDISKDHAFVQLQLLNIERAWAHAMAIKSAHGEDSTDQALKGPARRQIISRLHKAASNATHLVSLLSESSSGAKQSDILECEAYSRCMLGAEQFEKQFAIKHETSDAQKKAWNSCLTNYSEAHVIYAALLHHTQKEVFRETLASTVDPSIRYAAYQSRLPRSTPIPTIAKQSFRKDQTHLAKILQDIYPSAISEEAPKVNATTAKDADEITDIPTEISWRGRKAPIADASIGQAIAVTTLAASRLSKVFHPDDGSKPSQPTVESAFDPVLTAAQDTVDTVRRVLAQLAKEGVPESDSRTQDLRVTDLYANHALVAWRVGRNRVLISSPSSTSSPTQTNADEILDDGLYFPSQPPPKKKLRRRAGATQSDATPKAEPLTLQAKETKKHALTRLTTRTTLYASILQSLDSLTTLPGAARDSSFTREVTAQRSYFHALRTLNIAYAHQAIGNKREALVLLARSRDLLANASPDALPKPKPGTENQPPTLAITPMQYRAAVQHVTHLTAKQHGLVSLLHSQNRLDPTPTPQNGDIPAAKPSPLVFNLAHYPKSGEVDLENLVEYPPKIEPVPVKPVFLDLAFNAIVYPSEDSGSVLGSVLGGKGAGEGDGDADGKTDKDDKRKSRGWFGFGRS